MSNLFIVHLLLLFYLKTKGMDICPQCVTYASYSWRWQYRGFDFLAILLLHYSAWGAHASLDMAQQYTKPAGMFTTVLLIVMLKSAKLGIVGQLVGYVEMCPVPYRENSFVPITESQSPNPSLKSLLAIDNRVRTAIADLTEG